MLDTKKPDNNFINSLYIENFRNHQTLEINTKKSYVVIWGKNGVGKTSILEALSIFSNGKGLRNSKLVEMINVDENKFCIAINIQIEKNIVLELKSTYCKNEKVRKVYINGKENKNLGKLKNSFPMLWITPYDEKVFRGSPSSRRTFLDRLIDNFDSDHSRRIASYNTLIQQRAKVLKGNHDDNEWLTVIEDQLSKLAVSICSSRLDIVSRISNYLNLGFDGIPKLRIEFFESIENELLKKPAIEIEDELKIKFHDSRKLDMLMGGSLHGSHKTDFFCYNIEKNIPANSCSSGEQKLLLISIILSCAKAIKKSFNKSPILLLDEIFTHLDVVKKNFLFKQLRSLESQIWITTAETDNFLKKYDNVYYYELKTE